MRILEDHKHRTETCECLDLRGKGFQRSLAALLRRQLKRGIASIVGK